MSIFQNVVCCIALALTTFGIAQASSFPAEVEIRRLGPEEAWFYTGINSSDHLRGSVRGLGDVDGDGFADVSLCADYWAHNRYCLGLYGRAEQGTPVLDPATIETNNGIVFGNAIDLIPIGDFNGDGMADWVHVVPEADQWIVLGAPERLSTPFALAPLQGTRAIRLRHTYLDNAYLKPQISAAGDYNDDGFDDILVATVSDVDANEGTLDLILGRGGTPPATIDRSALPDHLRARVRFPRGFIDGDDSPWSVSELTANSYGDINGDGRSDIGLDGLNAAYVVFGSSEGLPPLIDYPSLTGENGFAILSAAMPDRPWSASQDSETPLNLGSLRLVGDLNGDGIDDLLLSTSNYSAQIDDRINVLHGIADSWPALLIADELAALSAYRVFDTSPWTLDAGDLNNDGLTDWLNDGVWAIPGIPGFYGSDDRDEDMSTFDIDGVNGFQLKPTLNRDYLSVHSTSPLGDFNGDGIDDLFISIPDTPGPIDDIDDFLSVGDPFAIPHTGLYGVLFGRAHDVARPVAVSGLYSAFARDFIELRWQRVPASSDLSIEIARNEEVIAMIDGDARHFIDADARRDTPYTYRVTTVGEAGNRSYPTYVRANNKFNFYPTLGGAIYSDSLAEIFWVMNDYQQLFSHEPFTVFRDDKAVASAPVLSWLDERYDPSGHTYHVETERVSYDDGVRFVYALRSDTLSLPEEDGTRPPAGVSNLSYDLKADGTLFIDWQAAAWGEAPLQYDVSSTSGFGGLTSETRLNGVVSPDDTLFFILIVTIDAQGRRSDAVPFAVNLDNMWPGILPRKVINLAVEDATDTTLSIAWNVAEEGSPITAFEINRDGTFLLSTTATHFVDTQLTADTQYTYRVVSVNAREQRSEAATLKALTAGGPFVPDSMDVKAYGPTVVEVSWSRAVGNATYAVGYDVYRNDQLLETIDALSFMDNSLQPGTHYRFAIRSVAQDGRRSENAIEASVTTPVR